MGSWEETMGITRDDEKQARMVAFIDGMAAWAKYGSTTKAVHHFSNNSTSDPTTSLTL